MPKSKIINYAGVTAAIGLAALPAFLTLAPMFSSMEVNAEPQTIGAAATIVPNLSLSAQNVSMVMTPTGSGSIFKTGSIDATVSTNNETGYTLYFSDKDDNTSLKHNNLADKAINSTEASVTGNDMLPNTWGYTLTTPAPEGEDEINNATNLGITYRSIPTDYTTINSSDTLTEGETSKLTFGVKINNGIPSGTYSDEILISAVINYSSAGYDQSKLWLGADGNQITTMQQMTPAVCASVPTPTITADGSNVPTITLTDIRNGEVYTVKKLVDGNCWMTSDLKIADKTLKPADSNVTTEITLPAAAGYASLKPAIYTAAQIANDGINDTYLYNFYAATAATSDVRDVTSGNAPQDICPKGWHLPNNDGNASWHKLLRVGQEGYQIATSDNDYNSSVVSWGTGTKFADADQNPLNMHLTGYFHGGTLSTTDYGGYWSRTSQSGTGAYYMSFYSGDVRPQNSNNKQYGRAVRCVADDKEYMQSWTGCDGLAQNSSVTLKDVRDNKEYTVAKLGDNKCWMTKNLNLAGSTALTSVDSNVTEDYTLPVSAPYGFNDNDTADVYNASDDTSKCNTEGCGGYYSWRAATANTGTTSLSHDGDRASADICPKGWHLPTKAEFSGITSYKSTFNPVLAGFYDKGSLLFRASLGVYWSSTAYSADNAYYLSDNVAQLNAGDNNSKRFGLSVRCVFGS